jgi:hypothetical protein
MLRHFKFVVSDSNASICPLVAEKTEWQKELEEMKLEKKE